MDLIIGAGLVLACVAGAKRGGGGRKARSLFPYPLPLSTPATQARLVQSVERSILA